MSNNNDLDPAASTQMFQAFVDRGAGNTPTQAGREIHQSGSANTGKVIGIVVAVLVVVAVVAFLALHK